MLLIVDIRVDGGLDLVSKFKPQLIEPTSKLWMGKGL